MPKCEIIPFCTFISKIILVHSEFTLFTARGEEEQIYFVHMQSGVSLDQAWYSGLYFLALSFDINSIPL